MTGPPTEDPLDDLDYAILDQLQDDGRRSYREISNQLGVTAATVRARTQRLVDNEVVKIVAVPNLRKLGVGVVAIVGLRLDPGRAAEVADILTAREETSYVGVAVTGYEVICEVALVSLAEFAQYREQVLARLPGFRTAEVSLMTDVRKILYRLQRSAGTATGHRTHDPLPEIAAPRTHTVRTGTATPFRTVSTDSQGDIDHDLHRGPRPA